MSDSFQTFEESADSNGHHHQPPVPEPEVYGAVLMGLILVMAFVQRRRRS